MAFGAEGDGATAQAAGNDAHRVTTMPEIEGGRRPLSPLCNRD
jgi:hypothetical protein